MIRPAAALAALPLLLAGCAGGFHPWNPLPPEYRFDRFEAADTDQDGKLDRGELGLAFPVFLPQFERIDADRSGKVSWSEFRSRARVRGYEPEPPRRVQL